MTRCVLVIDGDPAIQKLIKTTLVTEDVEVTAALDGPAGLHLARRLMPHVILIDVALPQLDGWQICRTLKSDPQTAPIPVLFISDETSTEQKVRGLELGAIDYIHKHCDPCELRARVRTAIRIKEMFDSLSRRAMIDGLTLTYNREFLEQRLGAELAEAKRHGRPLSCLVVDLVNFKIFNDMHGYPAGDEMLRAVAGLLKSSVRMEDVVARFGGDRFVLLLPQTTGGNACVLAERLRQAIEKLTISSRSGPVSVAAAFGAADYETAPARLLLAAEEAVMQAKIEGKNQVCRATAA